MISINPETLGAAQTATPALSRGLAILASLSQGGAVSLDAISSSLHLPKASVHRLLGTLVDLGLVRKTAAKQYEPLWQLAPVESPGKLFLERLDALQRSLVRETGATCEWYIPSNAGMRLNRQHQPERELCVWARPGFLRKWGDELDAVARLGYACWSEAPKPASRMFLFEKDGVPTQLNAGEARKRIRAAGSVRSASDIAFNVNGVRRFAVPVDRQGAFHGILALADSIRFPQPNDPDRLLEQLKTAIRQLP